MLESLTSTAYFNGSDLIENTEIVVQNGHIAQIKESNPTQDNNQLVIPGFIDLQIYGAGGRLFSADPTIESLQIIENTLLQQGTTGFLICLATNTPQIFNTAIKTVKEHRHFAKNCLGLHLEGPFINPKKSGAHIKDLIRKATLDEVKTLLDFGEGLIKMITIAPETQDEKVIDYLLDHGVVVSLGHSDASFAQATNAFNRGIQTTTHLFNAMSGLHHRQPGIPTAVFNHESAMASIIVDGHHVDFEVVKISAQLLKDRLFLITDAVTACTTGPYQHQLIDGKFVMPDGTLSGSALSMLDAVKNCIQHCGIPKTTAINMATKHPAKLIGIDGMMGEIKLGSQANLLVLDKELNIQQVIFKGQEIV